MNSAINLVIKNLTHKVDLLEISKQNLEYFSNCESMTEDEIGLLIFHLYIVLDDIRTIKDVLQKSNIAIVSGKIRNKPFRVVDIPDVTWALDYMKISDKNLQLHVRMLYNAKRKGRVDPLWNITSEPEMDPHYPFSAYRQFVYLGSEHQPHINP